MMLQKNREYGDYRTVAMAATAASLADMDMPLGFEDAMVTVWENGRLLHDEALEQIRSRANSERL
jgi:nicotinamide phosphoribosyltransferase